MSRWVAFLWFALLMSPAWPQSSTGTVSGTVRDQSAAMIPDASVTLTNTATNFVYRTKTNQTGFYLFPGVIPGPYLISADNFGVLIQIFLVGRPPLGVSNTNAAAATRMYERLRR